ncbi:tetratricopeptide repeat protein [Streptomyces collinus]|uniref:tetratricopeptide repeat protein n=1 Tax=Streptomyces collinus TaxID=42684 RepID=UPI0036973E77
MGEGLRIAGLAEAAQELDAVLRDPLRGACGAGLDDGRSLLVDQNHAVTYAAVSEAAGRAAKPGGLLILVWIGHGIAANGDFYVLPQGSIPAPGHPQGPYHLAQHLKELMAGAPDLNLVVLIDACSSGDGAAEAARGWTLLNGDARRRFQVLTAANTDEPAWDCAFTRGIATALRTGDIAAGTWLRVTDLKRAAERASRAQQPILMAWDGVDGRDAWVSRNAALLSEAGSLPAFLRADLSALRSGLRHFIAAPSLTEVVRALIEHSYVVLRGPAGYGKTTMLAALSRPEVSEGAVPEGFIHGLRLLKLHESAGRVAKDLAAQLRVTVEGFAAARAAFQASLSHAQWENTPETERTLLGPLRHLPAHTLVRLALDGFDQLSDTAAPDVADLIDQLRGLGQSTVDVRLVVSSRPGAAPPDADVEVVVDAADESHTGTYLRTRQVPERLLGAIAESSGGNWLITSLLADHVRADPDLDPSEVPRGLAAVYEEAFDRGLEGGAQWEEDDSPERVLFTVLAAAGPGAVLPAPLLLDACARLGSARVTQTWLRTGLPAPLRRFIVRSPAGEGEMATTLHGLFHQSLVDYLTRTSPGPRTSFAVDASAGHRSIAAAIAALAPADQRTPTTTRHPLQEYAERAEPDHLWHAGSLQEAIASLAAREMTVPADNLRRWLRWHDEALRTLGPDHPDALRVRGNIGGWTGKAGDAARALELLTALLPDRVRVLGPDHPDTLTTRSLIAHWSGMAGDAARALVLCTALLPDQARVLGPDHPDTLTTRGNIAGWTGAAGDATRALELLTALLPDRLRVLGPDDPGTLTTRNNIAGWTGTAGDAGRALELFTALLPDRVRVLGPDHPDTLRVRNSVAHWTGMAGDAGRALELLTALLPDRARVLGPDHPDTLTTRNNIAFWTGRTGRSSESLALFRELLPAWERAFGTEHPHNRQIRDRISDLENEVRKISESM